MPEDDLLRRIAAVEAELALLRNDLREQGIAMRLSESNASAARHLAAGADRDVSELRAEMQALTRALNALRMTQIELYSKHEADLGEMRNDITGLRQETRAGFELLARLIGERDD